MIETGQQTAAAAFTALAAAVDDAYNRGDMAAVAEVYADNASWCGSATGVLKGRAAIQAAFGKLAESGLKSIKNTVIETHAQGDQGYGVLHFQFFDAGGQLRYSGNTLSLLELQEGVWRIHHHWAVGDPQPK